MTAVQQGPAAPIAWLQKKLTRPAGDSRAGRVRHGVDEAPVPDAGST